MAEKKIETKKETKLDPKVWEVELNPDLIAQVLYVYMNNERKGTATAKTRGDVSGGGKKPWRQKGTGRARSGSIRSPLWIGGGVTFVPNHRNWKKSINKKIANKATCIMLSKRLKEEKIQFIDISKGKEVKDAREKIQDVLKGKTTVVSKDANTILAIRNVNDITVVDPDKLNSKHVVSARNLVIDNDSVKILEERLTDGK